MGAKPSLTPVSFLLSFLFMSTLALGAVTVSNSTCVSDSSSEVNVTIGTVSNAVQNVTTVTQNTFCPNGCNQRTGLCNSSDQGDVALATLVVPIIASIGLMVVGMLWKINRAWDVIYRVLFTFFGLFIMVGVIGTVNGFFALLPNVPQAVLTLSENNVVYMTWFLWIVTGIFITFTIIEILSWYVGFINDAARKKSKWKYWLEGEGA